MIAQDAEVARPTPTAPMSRPKTSTTSATTFTAFARSTATSTGRTRSTLVRNERQAPYSTLKGTPGRRA